MGAFHETKKSAAVLKHAIIDSYVTPFASKTGSTSKGNRVAFIDGYAGPGRYDDGQEGSGAMLLRKAHELAAMKSPRQIECHFVEDDEVTVAKLRGVVAAEGADVIHTITDEDISLHLPNLLDSVKEIPLFVYLDPCGLIIPFDEVARIFERSSSPGAPSTEVLINLTANLRRFAGILTSEKPVEASLKRIDDVCGGDWWRAVWKEHLPDKESAEAAVVEGYAERLRQRAGGLGTWLIEVRPRADLKPVYYLVFATRSNHGIVTFGDAASKGLEQWRKFQAEKAAEDTLFSGGNLWEKNWKIEEERLRERWVDVLAERLVIELEKGEGFRIIDRPNEVVGDLAGMVRTLHFRAAINKIRSAEKTTTDPKGIKDLYNLWITPA